MLPRIVKTILPGFLTAFRRYKPGRIEVSDPDIMERIRFNQVTEEDVGILHAWADEAAASMDRLVDRFYEHVKKTSQVKAILDKHTTVERQRPGVTRFFMTFFQGHIDDQYVAVRHHVGQIHDRIDLDSSWYVAMYEVIRREMVAAVKRSGAPRREVQRFAAAFDRIIQLDIGLVVTALTDSRAAEAESQTEAVGKSQAIIEFELDGTVIRANQNFLDALGYTADEVEGRHHRMFVDAEYARSAEYAEFWTRLGRGEFDRGEYKRLGKGGREVWIQASYNPVLGPDGKPRRVVKYATDVTARKAGTRRIGSAIDALARGDLSQRLPENLEGELSTIAQALNRALDRLDESLSQVAVASDQVSAAAEDISSGSQLLAQNTSEQASSLEEISASLQEVSSMTDQNSGNAREARGLSEAAQQTVERGTNSMVRLSEAMTGIKASSDRTAAIVKTIDEIAFQTNLLALNAAVEAARAGDAGKGFAVVAEEVRNLAQRSADAAKTTAQLIEESVTNAESGVALNMEVTEHLEEISRQVVKVSQVMGEISAASEEQSRGVSEISTAVERMSQVTQQTAANAEESSSASEELSGQSEEMKGMVRSFKLSGRDASARASHGSPARSNGGASWQGSNGHASAHAGNRNAATASVSAGNGNGHANGNGRISEAAAELIPFDDDGLYDF